MMAYLSLKKENIWNLDPKNELGYWFVADSYDTMSEMYKSLHRIFEKIIDIGTISKIVYPTPYDSNLASMVIEKIKISNQSFYQNIFSDLSYSDFNFFQNTLFDVYLNQEIKPMVFNLYNKKDNLEALNHPAKENGHLLAQDCVLCRSCRCKPVWHLYLSIYDAFPIAQYVLTYLAKQLYCRINQKRYEQGIQVSMPSGPALLDQRPGRLG